MRRTLSIRSRITLGSAAAALFVVLVAVVLIRVSAVGVLHSSDVSLATGDLASFEKDLATNRGDHVDAPGAGVLVLIRDPQGRTAVSSLPDEVREDVEKRKPSAEVFEAAEDGSPYVVVSATVSTPDGVWGLWAARSTASSSLVLERVDRSLVIGGILVLLILTGAAWMLAGFALRPVAAMRRKAESLSGAEDVGRLPVSPARDELTDLATTLNAFLDRVQESTLREKRMVSDAAHEIRTPLAALRTQLELAHDDFGDADALAREIQGAEDSVSRLTGLANGLLELSRLDGLQAPATPSVMTELVDEAMGAIDRARMLALRKDVDVTFSLDAPDDAARFPIERQSFARILDNLLSNAVNAANEHGAVELSLRVKEGMLEAEVIDDGHGLPDEFLPIAFDRFTRR